MYDPMPSTIAPLTHSCWAGVTRCVPAGDHPIREVFSHRELWSSTGHIGEGLLQVNGLWVINAKRNAGFLQVAGEVVSQPRAFALRVQLEGVLVEHVP